MVALLCNIIVFLHVDAIWEIIYAKSNVRFACLERALVVQQQEKQCNELVSSPILQSAHITTQSYLKIVK